MTLSMMTLMRTCQSRKRRRRKLRVGVKLRMLGRMERRNPVKRGGGKL